MVSKEVCLRGGVILNYEFIVVRYKLKIKLSRRSSASIKAFDEVPRTIYGKLLGIRRVTKITEILFKAGNRYCVDSY